MPTTLDDLIMSQRPTPARPLLGTMVLVVDDSRYACEALRLICKSLGARLRRAESLSSAHRHLAAYRPQVILVDLGLPDGSGLDLISECVAAERRIDLIIAVSGDDSARDIALSAGADAFLPKPIVSISAFQEIVLAADHVVEPAEIRAGEEVVPDTLALRDDLAHARTILERASDRTERAYIAQFIKGLGRFVGDDALIEISRCVAEGQPGLSERLSRRIEVLCPNE